MKEHKDDLAAEEIGSSAAALALVKLVAAGRTATTKEFLKILNANTMKKIRVIGVFS